MEHARRPDTLDAPATLDDLAVRLRTRREQAGSPTYTELARRVGALREARGVAPSVRLPGRVTVYDCFRSGRRRIDADLVADIVRALGADEDEVRTWKLWCEDLPRLAQSDAVVSAHLGTSTFSDPFVGREEDLGFVVGARRLLIAGMGGAGKTRLACQAIDRLVARREITDVVTVDVRGTDTARPASLTAIVESIERALGLVGTERTPRLRIGRISDALTARRIGLFLDDVATKEQVADLVRWCPRAPIIMTSRVTLPLTGILASPSSALPPAATVRVLELGAWDPDDGLTLLRARVGDERVDAEPEAAADIVGLTGGLPLAASLVAARVSAEPTWSLADHREALRRRGDTIQLDLVVQDAIAGSYTSLSPGARRALRLLATQPCEDLSLVQVAALLDESPEATRRTTDELLRLHCAGRPAPDRIGLHVLVRSFASARSWEEDAQAQRDHALDRLAAEMLEQAWSATEAVYAGAVLRSRTPTRTVREMTGPEGTAWLRSELGHLVDVVRALRPRAPGFVVDVTEAVGRFVQEQTSLAFSEAFFRDAVATAEQLGDAGALAVTHGFLVQALVAVGSPEAMPTLHTVLAHAEAAGLPRMVLGAKNSIGIVRGRAGDLAGAREAFFDVARGAADVPDADMIRVVVRDNAAIARHRLGDHAGAVREHREAIELARASGQVPVPVTAVACANLADPLLALGDLDGAEAAAREGLALAEGRSERVVTQALTALALVALARDDVDGALALLRSAREHEDESLDPSQRATLLLALGDALEANGDRDGAGRAWRRALDVAARASFTYEQARALLRLGRHAAGSERAGLLAACVEAFAQSGGAEVEEARAALGAA
ncbi:NB-ARC domain-containing protein [Salana multivorans]|uniref:NB-ARC domain-containing protein n=1 Tax=Salana multivorans TaxID=120377 RepID=A0A3N2D137_9MICO|nr:NB-ARC domain-containing protein [Salana multivorans]ROR93368.1 NB-ARC domain-containing protein [Salana multivorans]